MINKLKRVVENDGINEISRLPNDIEVMNKVNELVDHVNTIQKKKWYQFWK